jgi:DNA-directed RNA polymerase specialized sigma24 family protein
VELTSAIYTQYHKRTLEWLTHQIYVRGHINIDNARDQAQDCLQSAWQQLMVQDAQLDQFPGLLMTVAKRVWFEQLRQERMRQSNYVLAEPGRLHAYIIPELRQTIEALPLQQLEVWYLKIGKNWTHTQIADELRFAHNHVSCAVLTKARRNIKDAL